MPERDGTGIKAVNPEKKSGQAHIENEQVPKWGLINAEQVGRIVRLVKPKPKELEACREDVERITFQLSYENALHRELEKRRTKKGARALTKLGTLIRGFTIALKDEDLDSKIAFEVGAVFPSIEDLKRLSNTYLRLAETNKPGRGKSPRKKTKAKREAIARAHALLVKYRTPVVANDAKNNSLFCKLAAVLYGEPSANVSIQCQEYIRDNRKKSS
jgi:hypothetical protein